jgi:glycosyltransferase involved in cell wall biosynthesis
LAAIRARYRLPENFVLTVGNLQPRKNLERVLEATALLRRDGVDVHLALVGQPQYQVRRITRRIQELGLASSVTLTGYVADQDMPAIYSAAKALIYVSLMEGFGLPILEAMACGTPVISSAVSSPPEVTGDAALLVDPYDVRAIAAALRSVLDNDALRSDLRRRGYERVSLFSWEKTARQTLDIFHEVCAMHMRQAV